MSFAGVPGSSSGPKRFESIFGVVRDGAFVPSFKKDVSIRTSLPPGDLPKNTWSPIQQQFAYRLSSEKRPGTVIQYHKPTMTTKVKPSPTSKKEEPLFSRTQLERQWDRRVRQEEVENDIANEKYSMYGDYHREEALSKTTPNPQDHQQQPLTPQQQVESYRIASAQLLSGETTRAARYSFQRPFPTPTRRNSLNHNEKETQDSILTYEEDHGKPLLLHLHSDQRNDLLKSKRVEVLKREITSGPSRTSKDTAIMKSLVFPDSTTKQGGASSSLVSTSENQSQYGQCYEMDKEIQNQIKNQMNDQNHRKNKHNNNLSSMNSPQIMSLKNELKLRNQQRLKLQGANIDLQDQLATLHKNNGKLDKNRQKFYETSSSLSNSGLRNMNNSRPSSSSSASMKSPGVMSRNTLTSKEMFERQLESKTKIVF